MSVVDLHPEAISAGRPRPLRAGWKNVVLVCKACEKRRKAPKRLAAKALAKALRHACRDARLPRPRVVLTACMGACPKKAFTVATIRSGGVVMLAVERGDDAAAVVQTLFCPYSNSTSSTPSAT
jgi:predicted metal-binding protein